jgi:hypothetical protein
MVANAALLGVKYYLTICIDIYTNTWFEKATFRKYIG